MPHVMKHFFKLRNVLIRAACFWCALVLADFVLVYFFGPKFWSYAGYVFGNDVKVTLAVLMFIEGGVLLALGTLWASSSMENVQYGKYRKSYAYFSKEDWEKRREQIENPSDVVKILMLTGGVILITSIILVLA